MTIYQNPKNEQEMHELYVYLSKDEDGEGILAHIINGTAFPFVFGHKRMADKMRLIAEKVGKEKGGEIILVKYTNRELLEKIT